MSKSIQHIIGAASVVAVVATPFASTDIVKAAEPTVVTNVTHMLDGEKVKLTWESELAKRFRVQIYVQTETGEFIKEGFARTVSTKTYTSNALDPSKNYKFEVVPNISNLYDASKSTMTDVITLNSGEVGPTNPTPTDEVPTTATAISNIQLNIQAQKATVTWDALADAKRYRVQAYIQNADGEFVKEGAALTTTTTTFTSNTLKEDAVYKFEVTPYVDYKYQTELAGFSQEVTFTSPDSDNEEGSIPENVTGVKSVLNGQKATVTWDALADVKRYRVQAYIQNADGEFVKEGATLTTTTTTFTSNTLKENVVYKFEVTPYVDYKYQTALAGISQEVTFTSPDNDNEEGSISENVTGVTSALNGQKATVTWDALADVKRYRVQAYIQNADGEFVKSGAARAVTTPSYESETLKEDVVYKFEVTPYVNYKYATDRSGTSAPISLPPVITPEEPPVTTPEEEVNRPKTQVSNITNAISEDGQKVIVSWDAFEGATGYKLERYIKTEDGYELDRTIDYHTELSLATKTSVSFNINEFKENLTYKFEVTPGFGRYNDFEPDKANLAVNEFTVEARGIETYIDDVALSLHSLDNKATIWWDSVKDATKYKVQFYISVIDENTGREKSVPVGTAQEVTGTQFTTDALPMDHQGYTLAVTPFINGSYDERKSYWVHDVKFESGNDTSYDMRVWIDTKIQNSTTFSLKWLNDPYYSSYRIDVYEYNPTVQEFEFANTEVAPSANHVISTAESGKLYKVIVRALYGDDGLLTDDFYVTYVQM